MVTHSIPRGDAVSHAAPTGGAWPDQRPGRASGPDQPAGVNQGRHGPFRVPIHLASRCQRPGVDSGTLPRGPGARRFRGPLLLPDSRPSGARRRGQCVAEGNRDADHALSALLGGARAILGSALWHQRGAEDRRRGAGDPHRPAQGACRHQGRGGLCRPRPQVSDLGARTLPRGTRGGHREGSRVEEATGLPGGSGRSARSTGMMASSDSPSAVAGGLARHIPVLVRPAVDFLAIRAGGVYVDATFGAGGYSQEILAAADCTVIGLDRDPSAIMRAGELVQTMGGRLVLVEDQFSNLQAVAARFGHDAVDGVIFDLGVSSMQLDEAARGFSFRHDGPLDMRMGGTGPTAADGVAQASERDLAAIISTLGEERHARAIARAVTRAHRDAPIDSTRALAEIVGKVVHARPGTIHPATRTFQALRIFVNDELGELVAGLAAAERVLKPGGRLVVVAFHSLEDRIVKSFLTERSRRGGGSRHRPEVEHAQPTFNVLTKRPIVADEVEVAANPRARSPKLRAAEPPAAPPADADPSDLLPRLPSFAEVFGRGRSQSSPAARRRR